MTQSKRSWMIATGLTSFAIGSYFYDMNTVIIAALYTVVFIEIYRILWEYTTRDDNRMKMRYAVDGAFVFLLKEQYIAWILLKEDYDTALKLIAVYTSVMIIFVIIRIVLGFFSPSHIEKQKDNNEKNDKIP